MSVILNPYLEFSGQAREALEFYKAALGGEAQVTSFADGGIPREPGQENQIMHAQLETPDGITLMLSDGWRTPGDFQGGYSIAVSGDEGGKLEGIWGALSEGAKVMQPLGAAPWGGRFGMLKDKFGVKWTVNIAES